MRAFFSYFVTRYKSSSLKSKLFLSYFILIFIPVIVLAYVFFQQSSRVIATQAKNIADLYIKQTQDLVANELTKMSNVSYTISNRADIKKVLEENGNRLSFSQEFDLMKSLYEAIVSTKSIYNVDQIRLYIDDSFRYSNSEYVTFNLSEIQDDEWYKELVSSNKSQIFIPAYDFYSPSTQNQRLISVATIIRSEKDYSKISGVVTIDMQEENFNGLFKSGGLSYDGNVFLIDSNGSVLGRYGSSNELDVDYYLSMYKEKYQGQKSTEMSILVDEATIMGISAPVYTDIRLLSISSFEKLLMVSNRLKNQMIILSVLVGVIVYILAYFLSLYNSKRIKTLAEQIKLIDNGNFKVNCIVDSEDEIGELQNSFNFMARKINSLLDERYNMGKNLKGMELKALQAQINPHFLYNTLDLISWKAKKSGNEDIVDIVLKLARYYQISLSNGSDFIPVKDEIEHIRYYIELQNLRFNNAILLQTEIDPIVEDYLIMKLILQPIAENCVAHGIMNMDDRRGIINITAKLSGGFVKIVITDNGVGIEKSKLNQIISHEKTNTSAQNGGFGLLNIIDRLKLYYNDNYCFEISSELQKGTTITIKLPANSSSGQKIYIERDMEV